MTILIAFSHSQEGHAALAHGIHLSAKEDQHLVVFSFDTPSTADDGAIAAENLPEGMDAAGLTVSWRGPDHRSHDPAGDLLDTAEQLKASAIVVGVRRRSRVGKLILGSQAQKIIIDANVPVVAVKAGHNET